MSSNAASGAVPEVDVLVVGAGLSGIGMGAHLVTECPGTTFQIVEGRENIGGTWDLFRYPGVRSDSDMFTFGFRFKPWLGEKTLADGESIRNYINETADEFKLREKITFNTQVKSADWSDESARWLVTLEDRTTGEQSQINARVLHSAAGYYQYEAGHTPEFPGSESFEGEIVHPQHWPDNLDYAGKKIVVIGSGATAVTLVPAMSDEAEHVTMLQRTPTYIMTLPAVDPIAAFLRRKLPERLAYKVVRWKNVFQFMATFQLSRIAPGQVSKLIRWMAARQLPEGFDVDKHFNPPYGPWDQRLCVVPDGDFFRAIREGDVSIETDQIETFTPQGIRLKSGKELEADLIITATGLELMESFGGLDMTLNGEPLVLKETFAYKGVGLSGVPNFTYTLGYTNASWTLKADLVSEYLCRVINHMKQGGYTSFTPVAPARFKEELPFLDLSSGYITRKIADLPKQGDAVPWRVYQNYPRDVKLFRKAEIADGVMKFESKSPAATPVTA
ncbi:MAG: NAD(P)/FAD-dependent oxidoreductase [Thermoleophilaceae bacterium]|nr:NAD(P)/FAD-dependent oxidoreductase [Thermoleophilaceae bacterium]